MGEINWFSVVLTPASPATVSGAYFAALCKMRDAYGSPRASNCYVVIEYLRNVYNKFHWKKGL